MLAKEGLTTAGICRQVSDLKSQLLDDLPAPLSAAELLNPDSPARFLAFRHHDAASWKDALMAENVITDVRDDVLRIGLGLYHDAEDIDRFCEVASRVL